MTELVNFTFHILKKSNFRHKLAFKQVVRFLKSFSIYYLSRFKNDKNSSLIWASCLTAIKNHVIKYCTTVYERNGKKLFWSIKSSGEILNKLMSRGFLASGLSTYDFSTLYTTLPHNLIKEKTNRIN